MSRSLLVVRPSPELLLVPQHPVTIPAGTHYDDVLLARLKADLLIFRSLLDQANDHWGREDGIYRFYHQSFKVLLLQALTIEVVKALVRHATSRGLNPLFVDIIRRAMTPPEHDNWLESYLPVVTAFMHSHYFLEMIVKYAHELEEAPEMMPSGWAAVLTLYNAR